MTPPHLPATRRAVTFGEFGGPDVLRCVDLPMPLPQADEVLVRVEAATINPTDLMMLTGAQAAMMKDLSPPYIAGMEFAGRVAAVGANAAGWQVGQAVMGIVNPRRPQGGAHATHVCVPAASLAALDSGTDPARAATLPMNGLTARMCLESLSLPAGATLLVTGAAGAVGGFVIPLARRAGLHVVADAKDTDAALVRELGAHVVVPRGEAFAPAVRSLFPQGVDGLVDAALLGDVAAGLLRDGGSMVSLRSSQKITDTRIRQAYVSVIQQMTHTEALRWLVDRMRDGTLSARVAQRIPMPQAARGYELLRQGGMRGRLVLEMGDAPR